MGTFRFTQVFICSCSLRIVVLLLVFKCASEVHGDQAVFFDERNYEGNSLTLNIGGGCYKFKRKWIGRASSMQVERDACMIAWKNDDCTGQSMKVYSTSRDSSDLRSAGFDKRIRSVSLCTEISFRPALTGTDPGDSVEDSGEAGDGDSSKQKLEVNFYDEPEYAGSVFTLTLHAAGECYNFNSKWANKIASMELQGSCLKVWDTTECEGPFVRLDSSNTSPEEFRNLKRIRMDKRIRSVKLCNERQANRAPKNNDDSSQIDSSRNDDSKSRRIGDNNRQNSPKQRNRPSSQENIENDQSVVDVALREHNKYRRMHGVADLIWDHSLQINAQSYASYLANNNKFQHSKNNFDLGENLAGDSTEGKLDALREAIGLWYNEINHYNFDKPSQSVMGIQAGHFTQLVWKGTIHLGLGIAWNPRRRWWVIVANYSPAGNFKGEYESNVFPPI